MEAAEAPNLGSYKCSKKISRKKPDNKKRPRGSVNHFAEKTSRKQLKWGLASLMRPDDAAPDHVRCGVSRYIIAPTQATTIVAALRARWHYTSDFRAV